MAQGMDECSKAMMDMVELDNDPTGAADQIKKIIQVDGVDHVDVFNLDSRRGLVARVEKLEALVADLLDDRAGREADARAAELGIEVTSQMPAKPGEGEG